MSRFRKFLAMSFRAKLLVPVILVMICLLAVTAWIVDRQTEADGRVVQHALQHAQVARVLLGHVEVAVDHVVRL